MTTSMLAMRIAHGAAAAIFGCILQSAVTLALSTRQVSHEAFAVASAHPSRSDLHDSKAGQTDCSEANRTRWFAPSFTRWRLVTRLLQPANSQNTDDRCPNASIRSGSVGGSSCKPRKCGHAELKENFDRKISTKRFLRQLTTFAVDITVGRTNSVLKLTPVQLEQEFLLRKARLRY